VKTEQFVILSLGGKLKKKINFIKSPVKNKYRNFQLSCIAGCGLKVDRGKQLVFVKTVGIQASS